ncbi:HpcH/HpaI aldolase family protein [Treponema sp. SP13]|uniref:HpcH/HpaI aldolase family protein n=1 Tax=Treponema sp. SP13 TaxID=2789742 RepID=UPI003D8FC6A5
MINLKEKLHNCEPVAGMHISLTDCCCTELCGNIGYDFLWIDTEHSAIDLHCLEEHIISAKAADVCSLVRIPWNDPVMAKHVLEMGPTGIIFPMINTTEELDKAMNSTLYPPLGTRGFGPMRAVRYGLDDIDEYIHKASLDIVRAVQIETETAVDNLEAMAKNPYVDCFIFGPCDLSGSIGQLNRVFEDKTQNLIKRAIKILKKAAHKSIGVSTGSNDPEIIKRWVALGINFISAGTDYLHIVSGAKKELATIRQAQNKIFD